MLDLGLGVSMKREAKRLTALTDPEAYLTARLKEQAKVADNAHAIYKTFYDRYVAQGYPSEDADIRAKNAAKAVASLELKAIADEFPGLSNHEITSAQTGNAIRAGRKSRRPALGASPKAE